MISYVDKLTITCNEPQPGAHRVKLGDIDISNVVTAAHVALHPGELPDVTLTMHRTGASTVADGPARVRVDDETADALVALGWTPPAGPAPEPTEAHKHAEQLILDHAKAIEGLSISKRLAAEAHNLSDADYDARCADVAALIQSADVTVTWRANPEGGT